MVLVLNPNLTDEQQEELLTKVKKWVGKVKVDFWGKKELAYPLKKQNEGIYVLLNLEEGSFKEMERKLKMEDNILRFLLVRKEVKNGITKPK